MSSPPGISPGRRSRGARWRAGGRKEEPPGDPHVPTTSWCLRRPFCARGFPRSLPAAVLLLAPGVFAALWVGQRGGDPRGTSPGVIALLAEVGTEVRPHKTSMGDAGPCGARQGQDIMGVSSAPRQPPVTSGAGTEGGGCGLPGCPHPPRGHVPRLLHRVTHPGTAEPFGCKAAAPAKHISALSPQLSSVPAPFPKGWGASSRPR